MLFYEIAQTFHLFELSKWRGCFISHAPDEPNWRSGSVLACSCENIRKNHAKRRQALKRRVWCILRRTRVNSRGQKNPPPISRPFVARSKDTTRVSISAQCNRRKKAARR